MRWTIFAVVVVVIFGVFTTVYAASAERSKVRVLPKWVWVLLCAFVPAVGGLLYITVGRPVSDAGSGSASGGGVFRRGGPLAPDDDPQFLRDLAERIEREKQGDEDQTDEGTSK